MKKRAIAIACHPDDIEFMMAGTLVKLKEAGYEIHYMNVANGALGTAVLERDDAIALRRAEAMEAAGLIGVVYHESICDDMEVFYNSDLLGKLVETIREVDPEILLTHGPYDYMEDHVNAGRLAVSAAFSRGMRNFRCGGKFPPTMRDMAVYHSMPHTLTDSFRNPVIPGLYVDITSVMELKKAMLSCHRSQKEWLDASQGSNAYLEELTCRGRYYGKLSEAYKYAEGWIRHSHVGFGPEEFNPLPQQTMIRKGKC